MSPTQEGCTAADIITYLKSEARQLHKAALVGDANALKRIRERSPAVVLGADIQRKHALGTIAREIGFENWKHASDCFEGRLGATWGEFLYPKRCHVHWNIWFANYEEAKAVHADHDGYLLPYKNQFMIVDTDYIRSLGFEKNDHRWAAIARDWARPNNRRPIDDLAFQIAKSNLAGCSSSKPGAV